MIELVVRGARQHNLKDITVHIPRDRLVVITGPSGSGKSSLAFDTIYAEGQRRYVESLSVYARQFLGQMPKPDVDGIDGLSPAISVRQQGGSRNPRSTVGTLTEIYDYLRLLYARVGTPHSPMTGKEMRAFTVQEIVDVVLALPADARITISSPIGRDLTGDLERELSALRKDGFVRASIDGATHDLGETVRVDPKRKHTLEAQVDRIRVRPEARQRLTESVELALKRSSGFVRVSGDDGFDWLASERLVCVDSGEVFGNLTPRSFSFNSAEGACPACGGLGTTQEFDPDRIVPDASLSLHEGAIAAWGRPEGVYYQSHLETLASLLEVDLDAPWDKLAAAQQKRVLFGGAKGKGKGAVAYEGVVSGLQRRREQLIQKKGEKSSIEATLGDLEEELHRFAREGACTGCGGTRLAPLPRNVTVQGVTLPSLASMPLSELRTFFATIAVEGHKAQVISRLVRDVSTRAEALLELGLDYLTLDRSVTTLSGGEVERIRLATQIGSGLMGVLYVLDEPSAGLHARDNARLIASLQRLRDQGNSLIVVEHDEATIRAADHVIDVGPGAGAQGGRIVAQGAPLVLMQCADSPTGRYLAGLDRIRVPQRRRGGKGWLELSHVTLHNLSDVSVRIPRGALTCITGVSGSGKSSLIVDALLPAAKAILRGKPIEGTELIGMQAFDRIVDVDQSPIGRTPRSSPISYVGGFDELREMFSNLPESRARGYAASRFSFNVKGGRCETCRGDGLVRVDMQFLPAEFVRCDRCQGRRYNAETLEVKYRGHSIADVLDMSVDTASELFASTPKLRGRLMALREVGLGYVALGQAASTLSGGESQRIKLSRELARRVTGSTLLVLDEPTTGLHFVDVAVLLELLQQLVDAGNTVIVIEHHLDVVKVADYVIDLGPEGGPRGGQIVAEGTPEEIALVERSHTGRFLRDVLRA